MNFTPTTVQVKAFKKVEKAIMDARKLGLVFYGKSGSLVAYTRDADTYVNENGFNKCLGTGYKQLPFIYKDGLITDSGADDYPAFISKSDEDRFSDEP